MNRIKSIVMLLVLLIGIAPWGLLDICPTHSEGHEDDSQHHGSCEDGMMGSKHEEETDDNAQFTFESLPCSTLSPAINAHNIIPQVKPPAADQFIIAAVLLNILKWNVPEQKFYPQPDPQSNSDPPLGVNALRGPPLV